mgnify:CR=1 FL=1
MIIAYIPCGSEEEAEKISEALVKEKLIACANIYQSKSIYEWQGELKREGEWTIFAKTLPEKFEKIEKRVKELHSYELPCIIAMPIQEGNKTYLDWVKKTVIWIGKS